MLSNEGLNPSEDHKVVNRNSVEEEEHSEDSEDLWDDHEKDDVIEGEFEAFSDTDSETHQEVGEGEEDNSDEDDEAELLDQFDENISYRRHSCDDILEAVQAVKLNYSFPFQDSRQASLLYTVSSKSNEKLPLVALSQTARLRSVIYFNI